jgi:hypothetical protein
MNITQLQARVTTLSKLVEELEHDHRPATIVKVVTALAENQRVIVDVLQQHEARAANAGVE